MPSAPPLSDEERNRLQADYEALIEFYYSKVKEIVISTERLNKKQELSGPSIVEIRSAFDHVARAHAVLYGIHSEELLEGTGLTLYDYCRKNIDKAHGHLYRAAYDAYDVMAYDLSAEILEKLNQVSQEALYKIIPNAADLIKKPFKEANALVTAEKCKKDVVSKEEEESNFLQYEKAASTLADINDLIDEKIGFMFEYDRELKKGHLINKYSLTFGVIGVLLAIIIWLFPRSTPTENSQPTTNSTPKIGIQQQP